MLLANQHSQSQSATTDQQQVLRFGHDDGQLQILTRRIDLKRPARDVAGEQATILHVDGCVLSLTVR